MIEFTRNIPTHAEQNDIPVPGPQETAIPYWWTLAVVHWLQHKLTQLYSQLHLLSITHGRSLRWRRCCRQLIQAGVALLMVAAGMPLTSAAAVPLSSAAAMPRLSAAKAPSPLTPHSSAYAVNAANTLSLQAGSINPFNGVDVGYESTPSFADLDGDGDLDAFIGEYDGNINYFQNTGSATSPAFVQRSGSLDPFNGMSVGYDSTPIFADLDGDGDLDAFIGEAYGTIKYFENTGSATSPAFIERSGSLNPFNGVDVGGGSTPSFADLDADGDLDAISGESYGTIQYFQNTGSATSPAFIQIAGTLNPFNDLVVGYHSHPSFADLDEDGDLDSFIGEYYGTIKYFQNTGSATIPAFIQRSGSLNPFNDVYIFYDSVPRFADLDADGDLDAFIGGYNGTIQYIENTRNATSAAFIERSGSLNPFNNVDVGIHNTPNLADLDKDGDLDAVMGETDGILNYFQNTGSATSPAFVQRSGSLNPLNGVNVGSYSSPSFADLDGDGDLDAFSGEWYGTIQYFQNTGNATSPAFVQRSDSLNPLNGQDVGYASKPIFADLDADGDLDAFSGERYGAIRYYQNTGNATSPAFVQRTGSRNPFNGVDVGFASTLSFADLDGDGDLDAFIGEQDGFINYFQNTNRATSPTFVQRTGSLNPFNGVVVWDYSTPSFADLDADGDLDSFVGDQRGFINYFENILLSWRLNLPLVLR